MQEKKTERAPGGYEDFVAYLGTVRTEEELFSPLTYWFVGQNCPEDVCFRPQLVEARAKELGFWQGLTFKVEHWMTTSRAEAEAAGREAFQSRIGEDYAAYREKAEAPGSGRAAAAFLRPSSTSQSASTTSPSGT